jgi:glycosyltransferase involved in cell wall biosynthesis
MSTNHPIRILLVVRWPVGGIRTFIKYVYSNFTADKYQLTILGPDLPEMKSLVGDLSGVDVKFVALGEKPSFYRLLREVSSSLRGQRFDIVHSHGFTSGMCASFVSGLFGTPHILTSHDIFNASQFAGFSGGLKKIVLGATFRKTRCIHSVSSDAQENLFAYFPALKNTGKCVVISNGIEVDRFLNASPVNLREQLKVGRDVYLIGFLGRFMAQKGFRVLIEALEQLLSDPRVGKKPLVVAFGNGGFIREEKSLIAERGLSEHFVFLPFVPDVAGSIKGLDVVAIPSFWEACPLLPMEVLVSGTPLIATNCIGLREVVKDTPAYTVSPGSSAELARGLELFMENDPKQEFERFVQEASVRFSVNNQVRLLKQLIDCML